MGNHATGKRRNEPATAKYKATMVCTSICDWTENSKRLGHMQQHLQCDSELCKLCLKNGQ